jgi:hypothetical protein
VTAVFGQKQENFGRDHLPCFGLTWSNYVHTRIFLVRTDLVIKSGSGQEHPDQQQQQQKSSVKIETRLRRATVDFSPVLPNCVVPFIVDEYGIRGVNIKT